MSNFHITNICLFKIMMNFDENHVVDDVHATHEYYNEGI